MKEKESLRPLPKFNSNYISIIYYLQLIIKDLQKPKQSNNWPSSIYCPCYNCHECNSFFTQMINSSLCPCHAIEEGKVSCNDVILHLKEAIKRLKEQKKKPKLIR